MNRETCLIAASIFTLLASMSAVAQPPDQQDPRVRLQQYRDSRQQKLKENQQNTPGGDQPQFKKQDAPARTFQRPQFEPTEPKSEQTPFSVQKSNEGGQKSIQEQLQERKSLNLKKQEDNTPEPPKRTFSPNNRNFQIPQKDTSPGEPKVELQEPLKNRNSQNQERFKDLQKKNTKPNDSAIVEDAKETPNARQEFLNRNAKGLKKTPAPDATPYVPSKLPGKPDTDTVDTNKNDVRDRLQKLREQRNPNLKKVDTDPTKVDAGPAVDGQETPKPQNNQLQNRLEQLKKNKAAQKTETPAAGGTPEDSVKPGDVQKGNRQQLLDRLNQQRGNKKVDPTNATGETPVLGAKEAGTPAAGDRKQQILDRLNQQKNAKTGGALPGPGTKPGETPAAGQLDRKATFDQLKNTRLQNKVGDLQNKQGDRQAKFEEIRTGFLDKAKGSDRAALVGANIDPSIFKNAVKENKMLRRDDALTVLGNVQAKPRFDLSQPDLNLLNQGKMPQKFQNLDFNNYGKVHKYDQYHNNYGNINNVNINNVNININNNYFLPPPNPHFDSGFNLSWNYWDGRSYYDHDYASNIFINVGHVRHGGYDGCMVGGSYFAYGWGFVDGCIDYGDCRMWVPGFWAPYTVEECCACEVWMPPVYEEVWTGCCWETVMVDGGYFAPSPYGGDCHPVTRYTWVPGHYEYYR